MEQQAVGNAENPNALRLTHVQLPQQSGGDIRSRRRQDALQRMTTLINAALTDKWISASRAEALFAGGMWDRRPALAVLRRPLPGHSVMEIRAVQSRFRNVHALSGDPLCSKQLVEKPHEILPKAFRAVLRSVARH